MSHSPPLAPSLDSSGTVYLVLDDFGPLGRAYRETDETMADERTVIRDLISGEYHRPVRVIAFNVEEGWARDVSSDVARAVAVLAEQQDRSPSRTTVEFLERHLKAEEMPSGA